MVTGVSASNGAVAGGSPVDFDASGRDMVLMATPEKKSKKWAMVVIIVVAVILIIFGVVMTFAFNSLSSDEEANEIESSPIRIELQKLFKVADELSVYDGNELARIYIEGDFVATKDEINMKLTELDQSTIEYIAEYVERMTKYVDLLGEAVEIYYTDGCSGNTVEEISSCELSVGAEVEYLNKINEAQSLFDDAEYTIKAALRYYNRGGGDE